MDKLIYLMGGCLVGYDAVVIEIPDHGYVKDSFSGMDVRNICNLLGIGPLCLGPPVCPFWCALHRSRLTT